MLSRVLIVGPKPVTRSFNTALRKYWIFHHLQMKRKKSFLLAPRKSLLWKSMMGMQTPKLSSSQQCTFKLSMLHLLQQNVRSAFSFHRVTLVFPRNYPEIWQKCFCEKENYKKLSGDLTTIWRSVRRNISGDLTTTKKFKKLSGDLTKIWRSDKDSGVIFQIQDTSE